MTNSAIIKIRFGIAFAYFITLVFFLLFMGCSTQKDVIREKLVNVPVPALTVELQDVQAENVDSLLAASIDHLATESTLYKAQSVTYTKDTVSVKFYLKDKKTRQPKFEIEVQHAPVIYRDVDTTHIVQEKKSNVLTTFIIILFFVAVFIVLGYAIAKRWL